MKKAVPLVSFKRALSEYLYAHKNAKGKNFEIEILPTEKISGEFITIYRLHFRGKMAISITVHTDFRGCTYEEIVYFTDIFSNSDTIKISRFLKVFGYKISDIILYGKQNLYTNWYCFDSRDKKENK